MTFNELASNFFCVFYLYSTTYNNYFHTLIFTIINICNVVGMSITFLS